MVCHCVSLTEYYLKLQETHRELDLSVQPSCLTITRRGGATSIISPWVAINAIPPGTLIYANIMWTQTLITLALLCGTCVWCQTGVTCDPPCKAGTETCVQLSRCKGKQCNMCAETSSIQTKKATGLQIPGMGELQKQQLQMLLQAKMLQTQQQGQGNVATDPTVTDPVTAPSNDWSTIFGGNTASVGAAPASNSISMNDYFLSGYLFDGFGMGLMA